MTRDDFTKMQQSRFGVDWRWRVAGLIARDPSRWEASCADQIVQDAAEYIQLRENEKGKPKPADKKFACTAMAEQLSTDRTSADTLRILVLGDCPQSEIARRQRTSTEAIEAFEKLFFDVRRMRGAPSWVNHRVIYSASRSGKSELAVKFRAAFWGGPEVARALVDVLPPVDLDSADRIFSDEDRLRQKLRVALEMPLETERHRAKFIKASLMYEIQSAQQVLKKESFRQRCREANQKHQLAQKRHELAAERHAHCADGRRRRDEMQASRGNGQSNDLEGHPKHGRQTGGQFAVIQIDLGQPHRRAAGTLRRRRHDQRPGFGYSNNCRKKSALCRLASDVSDAAARANAARRRVPGGDWIELFREDYIQQVEGPVIDVGLGPFADDGQPLDDRIDGRLVAGPPRAPTTCS